MAFSAAVPHGAGNGSDDNVIAVSAMTANVFGTTEVLPLLYVYSFNGQGFLTKKRGKNNRLNHLDRHLHLRTVDAQLQQYHRLTDVKVNTSFKAGSLYSSQHQQHQQQDRRQHQRRLRRRRQQAACRHPLSVRQCMILYFKW